MAEEKSGSTPTGPSREYIRLIKGEISVRDYSKSVEKRVNTGRTIKPGRARPARRAGV